MIIDGKNDTRTIPELKKLMLGKVVRAGRDEPNEEIHLGVVIWIGTLNEYWAKRGRSPSEVYGSRTVVEIKMRHGGTDGVYHHMVIWEVAE